MMTTTTLIAEDDDNEEQEEEAPQLSNHLCVPLENRSQKIMVMTVRMRQCADFAPGAGQQQSFSRFHKKLLLAYDLSPTYSTAGQLTRVEKTSRRYRMPRTIPLITTAFPLVCEDSL